MTRDRGEYEALADAYQSLQQENAQLLTRLAEVETRLWEEQNDLARMRRVYRRWRASIPGRLAARAFRALLGKKKAP